MEELQKYIDNINSGLSTDTYLRLRMINQSIESLIYNPNIDKEKCFSRIERHLNKLEYNYIELLLGALGNLLILFEDEEEFEFCIILRDIIIFIENNII